MNAKLIEKLQNLVKLYEGSTTKPSAIALNDFSEVVELVNEHAALLAVAEAARHHFASVTHGDDDGSALNGEKLENALRNLAAVRGSDIPTSQQVSGKIYAGSHVAGSMDDNNNDN